MAWNVFTSWGGHMVYIVAGFIMPRMIDRHVGQTALGVWDFGWSIVSYFVLAQVGVGSSVNRYVAKHRAVGDLEGLRRTVSSVTCIQAAAAAFSVALTLATAWVLPFLYGSRLGMDTRTAQWVIGLLGTSVAVQMMFNAYGGVITGCHRWDVHNGLNSAFYGVSVAAMMLGLTLGGGLITLAALYLAGTLATELTRWWLAYRICPELKIGLKYATWDESRSLLVFGGKTVVDNLSRLLLGQANFILVATYLGPGALAVYARPVALVRHIENLTNKFAFLLSPAASSLKSTQQHDELRDLLIQATKFAAYFAMPLTVFLAILGTPILSLWMGPGYEPGPIMALLAAGNFLPLTLRPATHVRVGLNAHGRVGWASFAVAIAGVLAALVALGIFHTGLTGAALALVVPYALGNGVFVLVYACRRVGIPSMKFARAAFAGPAGCAIPLAIALWVVRVVFDGRPEYAVLAGMIASAAIIAPLYWVYALPNALRGRIVSAAGGLGARFAASRP
jgi:O-antigen/teichoic acid export membrane protein